VTREIWALQGRLDKRSPKRVRRLFEHPRFRAAYDFLKLRMEAGEADPELVDWWTRYQDTDDAGREAMLNELEPRGGGSGRSRRRRRRSHH
jgi:poly(A) polymerase